MGKASRSKKERAKAPVVAPTSRQRPSWLLPAAGAAVVAAVVVVVLVVALSGGAAKPPVWPADAAMPGTLAKKPPWPANTEQMLGRLDALGLPQLGAEGSVIHIHQHLDIWVNGKKATVPALIGIITTPTTIFSDLHTHDATGLMHVESAEKRTFFLGHFFGVWGVRLNARCIGGDCAAGPAKLQAWVNGKLWKGDPRDIQLKAHEEIALVFGTPAQQPKSIPKRYDFPAGS
jgi:hypothetical protein